MVQTFRVLQCFSCRIFQVDQVKVSTLKWSCKVCQEKQSVKRVFALGSGKDCRVASQKLNADRSAHERAQCAELLNDSPPFVVDVDELNGDSEIGDPDVAVLERENRGKTAGKTFSKWQGFVAECDDSRADASSEEEEHGIRVTLERCSRTKRRKIDQDCKGGGGTSTISSVDDPQGRGRSRHVFAEVNPTASEGVFSRRQLGDSAVESEFHLPSISYAAKENHPSFQIANAPARSFFTSSRSTASDREPDASTWLGGQTGRQWPPSADTGTRADAHSVARAQPIPSSHPSLSSVQIATGTVESGKKSNFLKAHQFGGSNFSSSRWSVFLDDCQSHNDASDDDDQLKACVSN